jgi:hypothetical protein
MQKLYIFSFGQFEIVDSHENATGKKLFITVELECFCKKVEK